MPRHVPELPAVSCPVVDIRLLARGPQAGELSRARLLMNRAVGPGRIAGRVLLCCWCRTSFCLLLHRETNFKQANANHQILISNHQMMAIGKNYQMLIASTHRVQHMHVYFASRPTHR